MKILIINGPNLNQLGLREPHIYGSETLEEINQRLLTQAEGYGLEVDFFQSNHEGDLIDALQRVVWAYDGAILNAAAYTHTSIALRDCLMAVSKPVVEVHLSNPAAREDFRHKSLLAGAVAGSICGFGAKSYEMALWWFHINDLNNHRLLTGPHD